MLEKLKITQQELSKRVGKSRSHITNILGLLKLPELVQEFVMSGQIDMGHARVLSKLKDEAQVLELAEKIVEEGLSVRQVEEIAKGVDRVVPQKQPKPAKSSEYVYVEGLIRDKYKAKVKVDEKKIVINYTDVDELNRILELMGVIEE
jgi:ParB family chromosome partitioning protein